MKVGSNFNLCLKKVTGDAFEGRDISDLPASLSFALKKILTRKEALKREKAKRHYRK